MPESVEDDIIGALDPIPVERIADAVERIAEAAETFQESGLTHEALLHMIKLAATRSVRLADIETVLDALPRLTDLLTDTDE